MLSGVIDTIDENRVPRRADALSAHSLKIVAPVRAVLRIEEDSEVIELADGEIARSIRHRHLRRTKIAISNPVIPRIRGAEVDEKNRLTDLMFANPAAETLQVLAPVEVRVRESRPAVDRTTRDFVEIR